MTQAPTMHSTLASSPQTSSTPTQARKSVDCRTMASDSHCSLKISGRADEVLAAARAHAIAVHGHKDEPELDDALLTMMSDETD